MRAALWPLMRCRCGHDIALHRSGGGRCLVCTCEAFVYDEEPASSKCLNLDEADFLRAFVDAVLSRGRGDEANG